MKPFERLFRIAAIIIKKDWRECRKPMLAIGAGLTLPVVLILSGKGNPDLALGMIGGATMAAPFLFANACFNVERQRGTLGLLLSLPMAPYELALGKFASLFAMTLITINAPLLLLGDARLLLHVNAAALFLATLFMSPAVMSDKPWAPQIPFLLILVLIALYPGKQLLTVLALHQNPLTLGALALTPVLTLVSTWVFSRANAE